MFQIFKKKQPIKKKQVRRFTALKNSSINNFALSYNRINAELKSDYIGLTLRARDLAKNNSMVVSFLNLMIRNVLGHIGFTLNVTSYNDDGTADTYANKAIQDKWYQYTHNKYVSADGMSNALDFDKQILYQFLTDGEVFLKKCPDPKSKFGIRFQIIDSLDVDTQYNYNFDGEYRICMGIKVDEHYKPISYFIRKNKNTDYYMTGEREQIKASEIIHIYRKQFANQVRGFTPLASIIQEVNALDTYKQAQINSSVLASVYMGIFEKTGSSADSFADYDQSQIDDNCNVATELISNVFKFAPQGYTLKSIQSNHPNSNVGNFIKAIIKQIASALNISSNKLNSDYESVNYSSLRMAQSEDISYFREVQQFLIDNWKNEQYKQFLKYLLISGLVNLPYSKIDKFLIHDFRAKGWQYLDPVKEYTATKLKLQMKLTNPLIEIEKQGLDAIDVLNGWQRWEQLCRQRNISTNPQTTYDIIKDVLENSVDEQENNKIEQE